MLPTPQAARSSLSAAKGGTIDPAKKDDKAARGGSEMSVFDTFSYGFDLPAGVQLNRINKKLYNWDTTRNHQEDNHASREKWCKDLMKKE